MSENSEIEWTDATWNPVLGCDKISPGCKNCYAIRTAWRLQHNPNPKIKAAFEGLTVLQGGQLNWTGKVRLVEERLREPLKWKASRRVFVNSQSDLFHEGLSDEQIDSVFAIMALCPQHTFQILTKRPSRMLRWMEQQRQDSSFTAGIVRDMVYRFDRYCPQVTLPVGTLHEHRLDGWRWPLRNVWLGTSVESPKYKDRIDRLRETPAAVRFLSLEPLLDDLGTIDLTGIHRVIVGGESGPGARPMHPDWARSLRDQCKAAGVPFFFKQWGEWIPSERGKPSEMQEGHGVPDNSIGPERVKWMLPDGRLCPIGEGGYAGGYVPDGMLTIRVGKKAAGRKLDGVEWSEYPQLQAAKAEIGK